MKIIMIISFVFLIGCSAKFDSFDPTTTALRWIMTNDGR